MNDHRLKDRKAREVNIPGHFTPGTGRDLDEEPAAEAFKADNSSHYEWGWRAAGKGDKKMVLKPKLNSTCKIATAGWDLRSARGMADLKARSKVKKTDENMVSL